MPNFTHHQIDYVCEMNKGHNNWAYADVIDPKILKQEVANGNVIVFFDEPKKKGESDRAYIK